MRACLAFALLLAALPALAAPPSLGTAKVSAEAPRWLGKPPKNPPSRIVTLAPSVTEIVLALSAGRRLVGVSRYDDAPEVARLPRVGGFLDPAPEAVLALRPDLVLVQPSPGNRGAVERLAKLGVPVLLLPLHTLDEIAASVQAVGAALGDEAAGAAKAKEIRDGVAAIAARTATLPKRKVLVVYGWQPLVVAGPGSFAHALLDAAGAENAAASASGHYPTLSAEAAVAASPEVIIDATGAHGAGVPIPGLPGRVVAAKSDALFRPGPRVVEALRELASLIHPGAIR